MHKGLGVALTLCLLLVGWVESQGQCTKPTPWTIGEKTPMDDSLGKVTVVALLQASWHFCLLQGASLKRLQEKLENNGFENISYMVVNHQGNSSRESYKLLKSSVKSEKIPVFQQEVNQPDVWKLLQGKKDDFLIYDSCGKLTYHLELPYTILSQPYVERAIRKTYCQAICTNCSLEHHPAACSGRNGKEETKPDTMEQPRQTSRRTQHQIVHPEVNEGLAGKQHNQNLTENTQLGQGKHAHHKKHRHHFQAELAPRGPGSVADNGPQQQNLWKSKITWKKEFKWKPNGLSELTGMRWCWYWRQQLGGKSSNNEVTWQWRAQSSSWLWQEQGKLTEGSLSESWQWRLIPVLWPQDRVRQSQWESWQGGQSWQWQNGQQWTVR